MVQVYGTIQQQAIAHVQALALRVIAEKLEQGEIILGLTRKMNNSSNNFLSIQAMYFLEKIVVPIVIDAAQLPPETGVEEFLDLNLNQYTDGNFEARLYCEQCGSDMCEDRPILGLSVIAMQLAQNSRANRLCKNIIELMMKDAVEVCYTSDLVGSTCLHGGLGPEFELRDGKAEKAWARWKATDEKIKSTFDSSFVFNVSSMSDILSLFQ